MYKYLIALVAVAAVLPGCLKSSTNCGAVTIGAPANELSDLTTYLASNSITATQDPRGFYYTINTPGTGAQPTVCNNVTVNYTGKLTNGVVFDSGTNVTFNLSQLIIGWQEAIPLIKEGGSITVYLPPTLAYGSSGSGSIPGNSILIFQIDLISVN